MWEHGTIARRFAFGASAVFLADVITGMTAYSVIVLSSLWYFAWTWVQMAARAAAVGGSFGTAAQLQWAWVGTIIALPMIPLVLFLATRAYRLPLGLVRSARHKVPTPLGTPTSPAT